MAVAAVACAVGTPGVRWVGGRTCCAGCTLRRARTRGVSPPPPRHPAEVGRCSSASSAAVPWAGGRPTWVVGARAAAARLCRGVTADFGTARCWLGLSGKALRRQCLFAGAVGSWCGGPAAGRRSAWEGTGTPVPPARAFLCRAVFRNHARGVLTPSQTAISTSMGSESEIFRAASSRGFGPH